MKQESFILTRHELYKLVWSEPVTILSKKYGLSDVGFAKICRRNNIPRPPRGYWSRKKSGQKVSITPLPHKDYDRTIEININHYKIENAGTKDPLFQRLSTLRKSIGTIIVPDSLIEPHPLIIKSAEILTTCQPAKNGLLSPLADQCLTIHVSKDCLLRALRIMDTLIKTLVSMGFEVSTTGTSTTAVTIFDDVLSIYIGEALVRKRIKAINHDIEGYYSFGYNRFEQYPSPSGRLFLAITDENSRWLSGQRHKWSDTESKKLEECLKSFVVGLVKISIAKKAVVKSAMKPPEHE